MSILDPELDALLSNVPTAQIDSLRIDEDTAQSDLIEDFLTQEFPSIEQFEQAPDPVLLSEGFYAKVLAGGGDVSQKIHSLLQKFLKETEPKQKGVYRQQLVNIWGALFDHLAGNFRNGSIEKRWALRYAYLLPTLLNNEQRTMIAKIITDKGFDEPIHYLDEWLDLVVDGKVNPLASDDLQISKGTVEARRKNKFNKVQGAKKAMSSLVNTLMLKREGIESSLEAGIQIILNHGPHPSFPNIQDTYNPNQQRTLKNVTAQLKELDKLNNELASSIEKMKDANHQIDNIHKEMGQMEASTLIDTSLVQNEVSSLRQIIKLCIGRQGNHFPFLIKGFLCLSISLVATRENTMRCMTEIEKIDSGVFKRTFMRKTMRIVPHTIIVPCFGDRGICWEPFEFSNRAMSRGRIAIPMFPKDIKLAVIYALGDLRWHVAKESAAQYWMEEGLTGEYLQYFDKNKGKGDVRLQFLDDYVLWVTKEVKGVQKLEKEVRSIFWRYIPFLQSVKDELRNRGFVYNTLYKKDLNRALSDGY